jgi:hypothetical protein
LDAIWVSTDSLGEFDLTPDLLRVIAKARQVTPRNG